MKRFILVTVIILATVSAKAQVRAVGIGLGGSETISLQHYIYGMDDCFFQLDFGYHTGVPSSGSTRLTATYNMVILSPEWTWMGEWNFYAGPGIQLGSGFTPLKSFNIGVAAQVGLEYVFDFPLQLSVDLRPSFGILLSEGRFKYDMDGLMGFIPVVSARYRF